MKRRIARRANCCAALLGIALAMVAPADVGDGVAEGVEAARAPVPENSGASEFERTQAVGVSQQPVTGSASLVNDDEPGVPLIVAGIVRDARGQPVEGALMHCFQADADGLYTRTRPMDEPNARLSAFVRTGRDGRYELRTIQPGGYPGREDRRGIKWKIPAHIHFEVDAARCEHRSFQLVFEDDPRMKLEHWVEWARRNHHPVGEVRIDSDGTRRCRLDIELADIVVPWPAPRNEVFHQSFEWSPGGTRIAFDEFAGGEFRFDKWAVFIANADGSNRRKVADGARGPTWAPSGTRLAFATREEGGAQVVWTVDAGGSGRTRVSPTDMDAGQPAWSPDGSRIAFTATVGEDNTEIFTMLAGGGDVRRVTDDPAHDFNPQWSPGGSRLVFYRQKGDGRDQIWTVRPDGSGESRVTDGTLHNFYPHFSSDRRIVYVQFDPLTKRASLVERDLHDATTHVLLENAGHWARRAPGSGRLAFIAGRWPQSAIYVHDEMTATFHRIVN